MDFHLKQWRNQQQQQQQQDESDQPSAKSPRLFDHDPPPHPHQHSCGSYGSPAPLPLFVSEHLSTKLSSFPSSAHSTATPGSRFPMGMGSYFSWGQWQELELQALIFRHMSTGAAVPSELLHLVKKSLLNSNNTTTHSPYNNNNNNNNNNYLHHSLQQFYPHYQPALLQSGYWGRGAMDPEPGRCRRTDGKKWRCSRDVVAAHKYCERHMHRGRNRSRKPVEIPTPSTTTTTSSGGANGGSGGGTLLLKSNNSIAAAHPLTAMSEGSHFALSGTRPPIDLLHFNHQRLPDPKIENKCIFEPPHSGSVCGDDKSGDRILRHFFDDWPKSDNTGSSSSPVGSATSLSISTPRDPPSDFSLTLSTGNGDDDDPARPDGVAERERLQRHWAAAGWGTNQVVAPMGGPLAEALRSSTSSSSPSPTSVLHQLQRGSISRTSYVST